MRLIKHCLNKQLADICNGSIQLEDLSSKVAKLLPENLASKCHVGSFNKGCLVLTTTSADWATQLRYLLPELRDKLRKELGLYQLSNLKVVIIEPAMEYGTSHPPKQHTISDQAKDMIIKESQQCNYQPLQKALLHLAKGD
jgi:hypothetical protein